VVGRAFAVALPRARERLVGLCAAALGTDGGGLRGDIAHGEGRRCREMRYREDRGNRASAGGCVQDGIAGFYGSATSLTRSVPRVAAV
jgi:hypothetical protein